MIKCLLTVGLGVAEILLIVACAALVVGVVISAIVRKIKGKSGCGDCCECCSQCAHCKLSSKDNVDETE